MQSMLGCVTSIAQQRLSSPFAHFKQAHMWFWLCAVTAGPFPQSLIRQSLFRARGDMASGEIKQVKEVDSVKAELPLFVTQEEAPDLYKMAEDDIVEIGPFAVRC